MKHFEGRRIRALVYVVTLLALGSPAHAEFVRVTAANTVGSSVYDVNFNSQLTTPLNTTDTLTHGRFSSVVLVPNVAQGTIDVLVADSQLGQVLRYPPPPTGSPAGTPPPPPVVVWTYSGVGSGPAHPDGLSVDAAGNLYIVTSKQNDSTTNQVWVLKASATGPTYYESTPRLIDQTFGNANGVKSLQDTSSVYVAGPAWALGDLLVLVGNNSNSNSQNNTNDANILLYRAATLAGILGGGAATLGPDAQLLTPANFPPGEYPVAFDIWPPDGVNPNATLLVATGAGNIWRYDFAASACAPNAAPCATLFASGIAGIQKLKVGLYLDVPYAFVTTSGTGSGAILELVAPDATHPTHIVTSVTQGVSSPDGLAVARASARLAQTCLFSSTTLPIGPKLPCDLSGGAIPHGIFPGSATAQSAVSGTVVESTCVVQIDPRYDAFGVFHPQSLNVSTVCPGFGNEWIPGSLYGHSGVTGKGFALARTIAAGTDNVPGLVIYSNEDPDQYILPGPANLPCPAAIAAWAPRQEPGSNEGTIVEQEPNGNPDFVELTGFCDSSGSLSRGMSVYGVGLALNVAALPSSGALNALQTYVETKYANLNATVTAANITDVPAGAGVKSQLQAGLSQIGTYLAEAESYPYGSAQANADYSCAALQAYNVDRYVQDGNGNPSLDYPGSTSNPNPWGEVRGRLANLYLTINSRILGGSNQTWPPDTVGSAGNPPDVLPVCPAPSTTLSAAPAQIQPAGDASAPGTSNTPGHVHLHWQADYYASCTRSGGNPGDGWAGALPASTGDLDVYGLTAATTWGLSCTGAGAATATVAQASVTVAKAPVIASFAPDQARINGGSATTLRWSVSDQTTDGSPVSATCSVAGNGLGYSDGGQDAQRLVSTGAIAAVTPPAATTFTLTCTNAAGGIAQSSTTVTAVPPPSALTLGAPAFVTQSNGFDLSWAATTYGGSCSLSSRNGTVSAGPLANPVDGAPHSYHVAAAVISDTYQLTCNNGVGGSASAPTVTVIVEPPPSLVAPFTATPPVVSTGGTATLSWGVGPSTTCTVAGLSGAPLAGSPTTVGSVSSVQTGALAATSSGIASYAYQLTCVNDAGLLLVDTITLQPPQIVVQSAPLASLTSFAITASPTPVVAGSTRVTTGESVTFGWAVQNALLCDISDNGTVVFGPSAATTATLAVTSAGSHSYVLACTNLATQPVRSSFSGNALTVTAVDPARIVTGLTASPATVPFGSAASLNWSVTPAGAVCTVTGQPGNLSYPVQGASGPLSTGPLTANETFTLSCTNGVDAYVTAVTSTAIVTVAPRAVAANSVGNAVYELTGLTSPGTVAALNTDGANHGSYVAVALVPGAAGLEPLAADLTRGQIVRYAGARPGAPVAGTVTFSAGGSGLAHPDGLSVDASANVYAVTSKLNDNTVNAVYVLPAASGYGRAQLVDNTFQGANGVKQLQETLVATSATATGGWAAGDLVVLVGNGSSSKSQPNSNQASVLVYRQAALASVLATGTPLLGPDHLALSPAQFPGGEYPTGMDVWPADAAITHPTLLVSTTAGRLLRFDLGAAGAAVAPTYTVFASNLGSGLNKVRVQVRSGVPIALVSQAVSGTAGRILEFQAPAAGSTGTNPPINTVTTGVNTPDGLAVTR
ncbi:MAG: hypothetical protein JSR54_07695 [Proteobacteria bacterium]|nr:hypothetical protein [Pseudomonadota bacterium]